MPHRPWALFVIAVSLLLFGCGQSVSPDAEHFAHVKTNLQTSDFKGALNNLDLILRNTNDEALRQQASLIRVALVTALADANQQLGEAYQLGGNEAAGRSKGGPFFKLRADYNSTARAYLMDAMQSVMDQRNKLGANPVEIQVPFPGFTGGTNETVQKIKAGRAVDDPERISAELQLERNALARILAALAGAGQDLNKGRDMYAAGKVSVDSRTYIVELSDAFLRVGAMFETRAANEPDKLRTVNQVVEQNLVVATKLLAAKPDKDMEERVKKMQADCDKCLKKLEPRKV